MAFLGFGKKKEEKKVPAEGKPLASARDDFAKSAVKSAPKPVRTDVHLGGKEVKETKKTSVKKASTKRKPLAEARNDFAKSATKSTKATVKVSSTDPSRRGGAEADYSNILIKPRITEKAAIIAEDGVYTFDVHPSASKKEVSKAIEQNFKVTPVKVNVINLKSKKVMRRGKRGKTARGRKAMVYLKKGDSIEFV